MKFALEASQLTPRIWIGEPDSAGTAFRAGKEDATDLAIHTVAEYTQQHFGGHLRADYSDMIVEVRVSGPDTPPTPQTINSEEELEALPAGVVVRSAAGTIACRHETGVGTIFGDERTFAPWSRLELPVTVLWHPTNADVPPTT